MKIPYWEKRTMCNFHTILTDRINLTLKRSLPSALTQSFYCKPVNIRLVQTSHFEDDGLTNCISYCSHYCRGKKLTK